MLDFITRPPTDLEAVRPGYSALAALVCGELAATVYSSLQEWSDACARGGWYSYLVDHAEVQVGICASTSAIVVAARGSSELADWRDDLHIFPLPWPPLVEAPGRVCRGFRAQGRRVMPDICQLVSTARRAFPAAPLYITGHSLGAALCPFLALGLEAAGFAVAAVYAHEMPRAFTRAGAEWYDARLGSRTFRVVVVNRGEQDLVTRVAPSCLGFRHDHLAHPRARRLVGRGAPVESPAGRAARRSRANGRALTGSTICGSLNSVRAAHPAEPRRKR